MPSVGEPKVRLRWAGRLLTKRLNWMVPGMAGKAWLPLFSVLEHKGRKTGKLRQTPVVAQAERGRFWLVVIFGEGSGWVRNVMAAQQATLTYRGEQWRLREPVLLEAKEASGMPGMTGLRLKLFGAHEVMRLEAERVAKA